MTEAPRILHFSAFIEYALILNGHMKHPCTTVRGKKRFPLYGKPFVSKGGKNLRSLHDN